MKKEQNEYGLFGRIREKLGWWWYGVTCKLFGNKQKKSASMAAKKRGQIIFCIAICALPILQFILFYICVNANSILLAFQKIDQNGERIFNGLENFKTLFRQFKTEAVFRYALKNSLIAYIAGSIINGFVTLFFAYYIYKKAFGGKFFKILLFMPTIISSIVLVLLYMYFVDSGLPTALEILTGKKFSGFYANFDTRFETVLIYSLVMGWGGNILMYLSAMNSINESVVEAARLDGTNNLQEFVYITFPMIYPTFSTFFVLGIAGIFTNQLNLVAFQGMDTSLARFQTFGYYLFRQAAEGEANYARLSALGILITLLVAPLTIFVRWLMERSGPNTEGK